jgi:hypothetical protein
MIVNEIQPERKSFVSSAKRQDFSSICGSPQPRYQDFDAIRLVHYSGICKLENIRHPQTPKKGRAGQRRGLRLFETRPATPGSPLPRLKLY